LTRLICAPSEESFRPVGEAFSLRRDTFRSRRILFIALNENVSEQNYKVKHEMEVCFREYLAVNHSAMRGKHGRRRTKKLKKSREAKSSRVEAFESETENLIS
jgi:hypothetical protein